MNSTALTCCGASAMIDALGQLFLQAKQSGRAVEIAGPQFAQVSLEQVGDARQRRLDRLDLLLFLDLEHDLDLEILHALAGGADQVDHHVRHFDKGRRLRRRRLGMHLLAMAAHEEEPAGASAEDGDEPEHGDDQLELALFGRQLCAIGRTFRLFVVRHCPARFHLGTNAVATSRAGTGPTTRYKAASAHALSMAATLR